MKRTLIRHKKGTLLSLSFLCVLMFVIFAMPKIFRDHYLFEVVNSTHTLASTTTEAFSFVPSYVSTPQSVKGIYMTSWIASQKNLRNPLVKIIEETEINTIVIDIKDYSGKIVFPITSSVLKKYGSEDVRIIDLQDFIEVLHKKGVYVIGRIAVFQDEYFVGHRPDLAVKNKAGDAVWKDRKGISWIDPASREYWDYIVMLSKEGRKVGFDEINFDYIRYPSDGDMENISYPWSSSTPKALVLRDFFQYLKENIQDSGLKISADLFGMTTTATDDMGIGQILENALPYFDYILPMIYPSHYPPDFQGFKDPEKYPYQVVYYALQEAVSRAEKASTTKEKLRPWLQDFGLKMVYGPSEVRAQIKATNDAGLTSWMLWSASNKYTRGALMDI